jgi:hypothetical protein
LLNAQKFTEEGFIKLKIIMYKMSKKKEDNLLKNMNLAPPPAKGNYCFEKLNNVKGNDSMSDRRLIRFIVVDTGIGVS